MKRVGIVLLLFLRLLKLAPEATAKDKSEELAASLIARAATLSGLRSEEHGPFRLEARIRVMQPSGPVEGTYLFAWHSPRQWMEEITFHGYSEQRVGGDRKLWWRRNTDYEPLRVWQLKQGIRLHSGLGLAFDANVGRVRRMRREQRELDCVQVRRKLSESLVPAVHELCFEPESGFLLLYQSSLIRIEYRDYRAVGSKIFPRSMRVYEREQLVVEATIGEIVLEKSDLSLFTPPSTSHLWPICEHPESARPAERGYPQSLEHNLRLKAEKLMISGRTYALLAVYGVLHTDGRWRDLAIIQNSDPQFDTYILEQLRSSRFIPAKCDGVPIPLEHVFQLEFVH